MTEQTTHYELDELFQKAEQLAQDFSLFPEYESSDKDAAIQGLLTVEQRNQQLDHLSTLGIDEYIRHVVQPSESTERCNAKTIIQQLSSRIVTDLEDGALYTAEAEVMFGNVRRRIGFVAQNRSVNNGVWGAQQHTLAAQQARLFARRAMPIVTFIDTPGADAGEAANMQNQAHSISHLITEMANHDVPTLGIIWGAGYSGGAIPLATTNILLSVRDGIFNTIQPQGLASIARKYNLSWQECAKYVGVSSVELCASGVIDGIIDYSPSQPDEQRQHLVNAITSAITAIEQRAVEFVKENPYIVKHYLRSVNRFIQPSNRLSELENDAHFYLADSPTAHSNVFGITYRYLRYLTTRHRIHSTTVENYGRLASPTLPKGDLNQRIEDETKRKFSNWLQAPEKIIYNDELNKLWKSFCTKYESRDQERSTLVRLFLGTPQDNYIGAKQELCFALGLYLFNRWKSDAVANFQGLMEYLKNHQNNHYLFRNSDILDTDRLMAVFDEAQENPLAQYIQKHISHEERQNLATLRNTNSDDFPAELARVINSIISEQIIPKSITDTLILSDHTRNELAQDTDGIHCIMLNRHILAETLPLCLKLEPETRDNIAHNEVTVLDVVLHDDLRENLITVCRNMRVFGLLYDNIIYNLSSVAKEANDNQSLSRSSLAQLLDRSLSMLNEGNYTEDQRTRFFNWLTYFVTSSQRGEFLKSVEEWKKLSFPRLSDTLFVVITFIFEKLLAEYYNSETEKKRYSGRINPASIGRRKDFWNRLSIAYQDLQIQELLDQVKAKHLITTDQLVDEFFVDFQETNANFMSANPVNFPGFRDSLEKALKKNITPCGVVTGIARLKDGSSDQRVGVVLSNLAFQAGAFDMASAQKFCKLLVECAEKHLPVVCFVSSGGMQTKEGAAALFSMSIVNDRITRFVRDNDLPMVVFGFGDCTGGAQASFVTHPLVQTYYFSGANIPFAGQIVVPSYLPSTCTLSNYLSVCEDTMDGLVEHPLRPDMDAKLRDIDHEIPVAKYRVSDVLNNILKGHVAAKRFAPDTSMHEVADKTFSKIKRVLIHARGCTAVKLIKKAQESKIAVVLVQSDPDMDSVAVDMLTDKDRAICIGGNTPDESYLNAKSVLRIAKNERVDALHPGIGFLSESSQFAALCGNNGINFIGPRVSSMEIMGNKSNAINTAMSADVPVVPGSHGIVSGSANAASIADTIGYPVLLKAVHGGGGKGIVVVNNASDMHNSFHQIATEAKAAFGNGDVYLEKYVTSLRHIEVQVLRDKDGCTRILGLRDCSVQRNNQKVIEESGSTLLPKALQEKAYQYSEQLANAVDYIGAGTVEYIYNLDADALYFMEMNTRLQVEHPVTELASNVDIVTAQYDIAQGKSIKHIKAQDNGYAIEVRITAEKPTLKGQDIDLTPTPGMIDVCTFPERDDITLISMAGAGKVVSPFYDSMIAQLICHGKDRNDTIANLRTYLDSIDISGVCTNIPLLKRILDDEQFKQGDYDTTYLPKLLARIDIDTLIEETEQAGMQNTNMSADSIRIDGSDELKVLSPSSSIYYSSSSPSEPAFVKEGDIISLQDTLCLMEAMKTFTPLALKNFNTSAATLYTAERYEISRIMNSDGQQVNQGDLLFVLKPVNS